VSPLYLSPTARLPALPLPGGQQSALQLLPMAPTLQSAQQQLWRQLLPRTLSPHVTSGAGDAGHTEFCGPQQLRGVLRDMLLLQQPAAAPAAVEQLPLPKTRFEGLQISAPLLPRSRSRPHTCAVVVLPPASPVVPGSPASKAIPGALSCFATAVEDATAARAAKTSVAAAVAARPEALALTDAQDADFRDCEALLAALAVLVE
jgi:hypothetical protein